MPLITSTAPTYSSTTPSMADSSFGLLVCERPGRPLAVPVGHRTSALLRHDVRFVRALLLQLERSPRGPGDECEARRREHPPGLRATRRACGGHARLGHRPGEVERPTALARERVQRHDL